MEHGVEVEPLRIGLHNFARYRHAVLDMSSIGVASVVGPNGAGKSSLIVDSILWALFGQTPRSGLRALNHVVRVGEAEAQVVFDFRLSNKMYRIRRTRNAHKNKSALFFGSRDIDGTTPHDIGDEDFEEISGSSLADTQRLIESTIRMDYSTFVTTAIIPQGGSDLFTAHMTDAERKEVLGKVLGLGVWDELLRQVREALRQVERELALLEQRQSQAEERFVNKEQLEEELRQAEASLEELESQLEHAETIRTLEHELQQVTAELERIEADIAQTQQNIESYNDILSRKHLIEDAPRQYAESKARLDELKQEVDTYYTLHSQFLQARQRSSSWEAEQLAVITRLETALQHAKKMQELLVAVPCQGMDIQPRCHLLSDALAASSETERLLSELQEARMKPNPHLEEIQRLNEAMSKYDVEENNARIEHLQQILRELHAETKLAPMLETAQQQVTIHSVSLARLVAERVCKKVDKQRILEAIQAESLLVDGSLDLLQANYAALQQSIGGLKERLSGVVEAEKELKAISEEMEKKSRQQRLLKVLEEACNKRTGVPALIVENAVPQIEVFANKTLESISGGRLSIRLETQAETKAGTVQEVFQIWVLDSGVERPYITYSGAERFMVDLSLRIGLSKFLAHRAGSSIRFLVIDEGIAAADAANRQHIIDALLALEEHFSKVIVISHIPELHDAMPQRIEVSRDVYTSSVQLVA